MEDLFTRFWWIIFPIFGMIMAVIGTISHYQSRKDKITMIKSYLDQGKEPPEALIKALTTEENDDYRRHHKSRHNPFTGFIVFAALAGGFGYAGFILNIAAPFQALAVGFGIAAIGALIGAVFMRPK